MPPKKTKKGIWERLPFYPSFIVRFSATLIIIVLIFFVLTYLLVFRIKIATNISDQISIVNLLIQAATLVLGVFATYFALRQLVETRFNGLDETATAELKRNHYSRAFEKWREAFYIKPEPRVFNNMCESLLFVGDFDSFDQFIHMSSVPGSLKNELSKEHSNKVTLLYLQAARHLLVENLGEAKKIINILLTHVKNHGLEGFHWDFFDFIRSPLYLKLNQECEAKRIIDNLISYLSQNIQPKRKKAFESENFASQISESENT